MTGRPVSCNTCPVARYMCCRIVVVLMVVMMTY